MFFPIWSYCKFWYIRRIEEGDAFLLKWGCVQPGASARKISEGSILLKGGEARPLDGPTEAGTGIARPQLVPLSQLIDIVSERFSTDFNQADLLFFDQVVEAAMANDGIQQAAVVNPGDKFEDAVSFSATWECEHLDQHSFQTQAEARMATFKFIDS